MDVRDFLKSPDLVTLKLTKKYELRDIAKELRIEVKKGVTKVEIQRKIVEYYIDKGTLDEEALELFVEGESTQDELQLLLEIVNREHELKLKQLEREVREAERRGVHEAKEAEIQRQLEREKWQREDQVAERQRQFKRERLQQTGLESDPDDFYSSEGLVPCDEFKSCVPDEVRAYPVAEDVPTLKGFDKKADKEVLTCEVELTPEGSLPENSWEVRDDLEFETGTSDDSPEEAVVPIECVQVVEVPVDSQDSEPCVETQLRSEVSDLVGKECSFCVSDGLGSVNKGLALVPVECEDSQSFVVDHVLKAGSNGKSAVPGLLDKVMEKVGLVARPLTLLAGQKPAETGCAALLQFVWTFGSQQLHGHAAIQSDIMERKKNCCGFGVEVAMDTSRNIGRNQMGSLFGLFHNVYMILISLMMVLSLINNGGMLTALQDKSVSAIQLMSKVAIETPNKAKINGKIDDWNSFKNLLSRTP